MLTVITYDISDDRRRSQLSTFLEGYGRRVQYSVFECYLSLAEMRQLYQQVKRRVKPEEDSVRMYWLSEKAVSRVLTVGSPAPEPPPDVYII